MCTNSDMLILLACLTSSHLHGSFWHAWLSSHVWLPLTLTCVTPPRMFGYLSHAWLLLTCLATSHMRGSSLHVWLPLTCVAPPYIFGKTSPMLGSTIHVLLPLTCVAPFNMLATSHMRGSSHMSNYPSHQWLFSHACMAPLYTVCLNHKCFLLARIGEFNNN
jgi:hypothetical protein